MIRLTIGLLLIASLLSCKESGNPVPDESPDRLPPQYYYYPKANIYFDSANKLYFFQTADSLSWQSAAQIPAVMVGLLDKSIRIADTAHPVWQHNANHRLIYSAILYATPNDTVVAKKPLRISKKPAFDGGDSSASGSGKRKGFRGFLDRIFKRDKKNKEAQK